MAIFPTINARDIINERREMQTQKREIREQMPPSPAGSDARRWSVSEDRHVQGRTGVRSPYHIDESALKADFQE